MHHGIAFSERDTCNAALYFDLIHNMLYIRENMKLKLTDLLSV